MNIHPSEPGSSVEAISQSPADTLALGRRLAGVLLPGDIVLLVGKLGAGKTLLAAGIAEGLGVEDPVTSPTFVIVRSYDGLVPVHHADLYRIASNGEFDDLDLLEQSQDGVLLIEWGNVVTSALPADRLVVELLVDGERERTLRFTPYGGFCKRELTGLVA